MKENKKIKCLFLIILSYLSKARDTQSDKMSNATSWMENRAMCHTIRFLSYEVGWSWMELNGTRSDPYDVISSLLEKDNIIRAHCFKKIKSMGL